MSFTSLEELRALVKLIDTSFEQIEHACVAQGEDLPSLHLPSIPQSEAILTSPDVVKAGSVITAAAFQLAAAVRPSTLSLFAQSLQYHISSALGIAIQAHVPEILREAGPNGLDAKDISQYTGISSEKLAHLLRLLATNYIFKEVTPNTFANNRLSASMDTGKSVKEILADPHSKYDGTANIAAMLENVTAEGLPSAACLPDVLFNPKLTNSGEPNQATFNTAFKTGLTYPEWLSQPENSYRRKRAAIGMHAANKITAHGVILKGFDWKALPPGSIVVDVAGGIGTQTKILAKEFDHLKHVVQDLSVVMSEEAPKFWNEDFSEAISSGRVKLQAHDIFTPQPIRDAAVFFIRAVTHDWSDEYCVKILSNLRAAATPTTQLVVIDNVIPYACNDSQKSIDLDVPGANDIRPIAPPPLLPNFGAASMMTYLGDLTMLNYMNGHERTVSEFASIFERSGWKLVRVHSDGFNYHDIKIIGDPA